MQDAGSGNSAPPKLGELFHVSGSQTFQNEREIGLKSSSMNGMGGSGATASSRIAEQQERETARRKASNDTVMFLQMLEELAEQVKALEEQIEHYDNQIEATDSLIGILESGGEIDPTDPEHQRLLRLAGIPEEEWGTVTLEDLRKHREELQAERDKAKDQLDKKVAEGAAYEQAESNLRQGNPVSGSTLPTPEAVEEYAKRNPDADLEDLSRRDLLEIRKINLVSEYIARSEHTEKGIEWLKAGYAELRISSDASEQDFKQNFESLINELSPDDVALLLQEDHGFDQRANIYLARMKLEDIQSQYDLENPDERMMFEMELETFDGVRKSALLSDPKTDPAIRELLGGNPENTEVGSDLNVPN